jgi:hypothetical protein
MPALFFPNLNALRLALSSGLVPARISRASADAGFEPDGRLWLQPAEWPPRESLAALVRLGVQALGGSGVPTSPVSCWAELLPLQATSELPAGLVVFLVPDRQIAKFVAKLNRAAHREFAAALPDTTPQGHGWVSVVNPPASILAETTEQTSPIEAFTEQAPNVWVRLGWRHPVVDHFAVPTGKMLLLQPPRSVLALSAEVPVPQPDEFRLRAASTPAVPSPPAPVVPVKLTLRPARVPGRESLWVLDATGAAEFWAFCAGADERLIAQLEAAVVGSGSGSRLVVRVTGKKKTVTFAPPGATGYAHDARVPGLFVPANQMIRPVLRVRELAQALGVGSGKLVWVEANTSGETGEVVPHAVSEAAFRVVADLIEYTTQAAKPLDIPVRGEAFPLARFVVIPDLVTLPEPTPEAPPAGEEAEAAIDLADFEERPGWLVRSLGKLFGRLRSRKKPAAPAKPTPSAREPKSLAANPVRPVHPGHRVERNLASPAALLHGPDWATRHRELEDRLFRELPQLGPGSRSELWADLAAVYSATGNASDAAVCWMNAIWESPAPPTDWLEDWLATECRAAKLTETAGGLERWLSEPGRPGIGRVVAAYTALAGSAPNPSTEFLSALPRLLAFLDQHFDDLPVRAAWIARLAAARVCDGDALGLARWRDRVLTRLAEGGPGLDLDEPSFLRFHGTASAERFQMVREGLEKVGEQSLKWVKGLGSSGRLQFAGIDAETTCTAAYAQFMFAWGFGCLGERRQAKEWAAKARKVVAHASGRGVDPATHAVLGDLFLLRVREAQEGRAAKPGLPAALQARIDALPESARYAVERLRKYSRILEPLDRAQAYRGLDLKVFLGSDRLGERLFLLTGRNDREQLAEEADDLLRLCVESPTTQAVPRVVLALLEVAPRLLPAVLLRVLDLLPTAVDWLEAWIAVGRWRNEEKPRLLVRYQSRMLEAGFAVASSLPPAIVSAVVGAMLRRLLALGDSMRAPIFAICTSVFRALRRLGLRAEAEVLVHFLDPEPKPADAGEFSPARLGLAVGWYTVGNDDSALHILEEARKAFLLTRNPDNNERTALALAYAEAVGFAPPRVAHGRLGELFQQLGAVAINGGTNSYFTLQPLRLIDAVVRSVITDDFSLGSAVRSWLDDDEFLIRSRIHRDLATVLREQGIS